MEFPETIHAQPGERTWPMMVSRAVCLAVCVVALGWLVVLLLTRKAIEIHWVTQTCFAAAAFLSSSYVAITQYQFWRSPLIRVQRLVGLIREGEAAIDELSAIRGGIEPLIPPLQQLLHELRQSRQDLDKLQVEMRQRVAQRTVALERKIGSLRQQATKDALTGLYNRRMLDAHLPPLLSEARRSGEDLGVLMMDVDNFKFVNDTLGHEAGDRLLIDVARILRSSIREEDLAFRCGGDEFLVVMPNATAAAAGALSDRLMVLVDQLARPFHVKARPRLSVGVSMLSGGDIGGEVSGDDLLRRADQSLYQMKSERKVRSPIGRGTVHGRVWAA